MIVGGVFGGVVDTYSSPSKEEGRGRLDIGMRMGLVGLGGVRFPFDRWQCFEMFHSHDACNPPHTYTVHIPSRAK